MKALVLTCLICSACEPFASLWIGCVLFCVVADRFCSSRLVAALLVFWRRWDP